MRMEESIAAYRLRLMAIVAQAPSVTAGCAQVGVHRSTYYGWVKAVERDGVDGLLPKSRGRSVSPSRRRLEAKVVAAALTRPGLGPELLFDELVEVGVEVGSASQVWRILRAHSLSTRAARRRLMAMARGLHLADEALLPARTRSKAGPLKAAKPGDLVQMDCFHLGELKESRIGSAKKQGVVWQYTAIDVASSFVWAEIHTTAHNPSAQHTTALAMRVAQDLAAWGWALEVVSTDRGNEFTAQAFGDTIADLGAIHRFIKPGRPQSNGKVEQVQDTIQQECWLAAFATYQQPSITGLRQDLDDYLNDYNHRRRHRGKWNNGQPPINIIDPTRNTP